MSRSGRIPISIPENTEIKIENNVIFAKGKLGELSYNFKSNAKVEVKDKTIHVHKSGDSITQQKALGKRSLAPVAVVRLLLGGEDSRTRGERARFRVHGKGRHISTRVRVRKVTRDCVCLSGIYFFLFFCVMCV